MKKSMIKKILSICATLALAFVAVVTLTAPNKHISVNAEEPTLPDTSTWEEVDASVGDLLTGVWYRAYFDENYYTEILSFNSENYKTKYSGNTEYTEDTVPSEGKIYSITLRASKQDKAASFSGDSGSGSCNLRDIIPYNITETYIDFYIPTSLEVDMGTRYCAGPQVTIGRVVTLKEDAKITTVKGELKKLVEPTPDDGTETPDDGTEEPKGATTDKVANWLNDTFGMNTNGNTVGAIAVVLAGVLILKFVFGKK